MSSFTSPLIVSPLNDGRKWQLKRSFTYHIDSRYSNNKIEVPEGFITDFASIPWMFWSFLPSWGKYGKAAVLHDCLYQNPVVFTTKDGGKLYLAGAWRPYTRKEADQIFYRAMIVGGTKKWKARLMYFAVRVFGFLSWTKS